MLRQQSFRNSGTGDSDDGEIGGQEIDDDFTEGGGETREETRAKKSFIWMILFILWRTRMIVFVLWMIRNWSTRKIRFVEFVKALPFLLFPLIPPVKYLSRRIQDSLVGSQREEDSNRCLRSSCAVSCCTLSMFIS